jgi:O-acetyl-ADP-ribose deacetylase (regulator of RNase III)
MKKKGLRRFEPALWHTYKRAPPAQRHQSMAKRGSTDAENLMVSPDGIRWTHKSVKRLAGAEDPVAAIERLARAKVLEAMDAGWNGPPFNPLQIADLMRIPVEADSDVADARTVPFPGGIKIQFNPTQARERLRFSIAHEIAHALFPDVAEELRHRGATRRGDDWQLEMLCNLAAAEFIMPLGSLPFLEAVPALEVLMMERRKFDVSPEAFLLRVAKVTAEPVLVFCASPQQTDRGSVGYRIDYVVASGSRVSKAHAGVLLPGDSPIGECTAVGYTSRGMIEWPGLGKLSIECVGVSAYPGDLLPRVAGIVRNARVATGGARVEFIQGDVFAARDNGPHIICQLVNDRARVWGGGVARISAKKYPAAQTSYAHWFMSHGAHRRLGSVHLAQVERNRTLASLVAQQGYGPSPTPRIRYAALEKCFSSLAQAAVERRASVRMPRLGTGEAGGVWSRIEELIQSELVSRGIRVTVHDLPPQRMKAEADLFTK